MPGKYGPLEGHMRSLSACQQEVKLTFEQIESILKRKIHAVHPRKSDTHARPV